MYGNVLSYPLDDAGFAKGADTAFGGARGAPCPEQRLVGATSGSAKNGAFWCNWCIGWMDNGFNYAALNIDLGYSSYLGVSLPTQNQLLVRFAYYGDANLDGQVDSSDSTLLSYGYNGRGTGWVFSDFNIDGTVTSSDIQDLDDNYGLSTTSANYAPAFQPTGILINPIEGVPFSGDLAAFTDLLNPTNADPSIYQAQVNWGDGSFVAAQVTATDTPGSFRINAVSPALTNPNAVMAVIIQYADMNDPSPTYLGRPAAVVEPILFAPAPPVALEVGGVTDTEVDLTWTQGVGDTPATSYTIYRNGQQIGTTNALAYEDTGLIAGTQYTYWVKAVASTGASSSSQQVQATTTSLLAGTTSPPTPTNISASSTSSSSATSVKLTWSGGQNLEYEIERNGVDIALTNTTSYTDSGVMPYSVYTYSIIAYDPVNGNLSQPASYTATTGSDELTTYLSSLTATTAANGPVTLSWDQPADPAGSSYYIVARSQQIGIIYGSPITFPNVYTTTFSDSTAVTGNTYQYSVTEVNGIGGHSQPASVIVTAGIPPVDQAAAQDIPQSYMDYFYNSLTKTFRELDAYAGYNNDGTGTVYNGVAPPAAQGWFDPGIDVNVTELPGYQYGEFQSGVYQVFYNDHNSNGTYDPGESLWYSQFPSNTFASGDAVLAGPTPPVGALGTNGGTPFYFVDESGNGEADFPEIIPKDANQLQGIEGKLAYRDIGGVGYWTPSDPIWYDANGNSMYDDGEKIIYEPVTPQPGDWGKENGLAFYDMQGSGHWDPNDPVWADQNSVESDSPSAGGTTDPQTVFRADFAAFYPAVESLVPSFIDPDNGTQLNLQNVFSMLGMSDADWTKVPATTGPDGISLSKVDGKPDANSAVFPVQFQELSSVLSKLTTIPGFRFTKTDSEEFNATAQVVLGAYGSLFGQNDSSQIALTKDVISGYTSEGALESGTWSLLEAMVTKIAGAIYARQGGAWEMGTGSSPETFIQYDPPNFPGVSSSDGVAAENNSINSYLQAILSNGMWIKNTQSMGIARSFPGSEGTSYGSSDPRVPWPNYPSLPYPTSDFTGVDKEDTIYGTDVGGAGFGVAQPDDYSQFGNANWVGYTLTITLPAAPSLGGLTATSLAAGPGGNVPIPDVSGSGTALTVFSASVDQIGSIIENLFPKTSDLQNTPLGVTTYYDVTDANAPYAYNGVVGNPHIVQYSLSENAQLPYDGNGAEAEWYASLTLYIDVTPPSSVYGLVPDGASSVTPFIVQPPIIDRSSPPGGAIPLQSQMSLLNVVPDTNLDDIVQVDHDQTSFGNDTGSISYEMQREMPQVYIPLNTDGTDAGSTLPIHNYLSQGGFGTSLDSVGTLLDQDGWTYANANENGQPYADSLDTSVNNSLLIIDAANHVKRVEVIRPRGNAVIFDFAWNTSTQEFSPYGHPVDLNADRLYVLRDVTPYDNSDLQYDLEFPSGIVQHFQDNYTFIGNEMVDVGTLHSVTDTNSGLTAGVSYASLSNPINTPRYSISAQWSGGQIVEMDYTSSISSSATIKTAFTYGSGNQITELDKTNNSSEIPEFSYLVSGDSVEQDDGAIKVTRTGSTDGHSGDVILTTTIQDQNVVGSSAEEVALSAGLITSDTVSLNTVDLETGLPISSTATTTYTYATGTGFYNNGAPQWGKVTDVLNPDGSWVHNVYDPTTGWLTDQYTPFKSSVSPDSSSRHVVFDYNAADSGGGDGVDANSLVPMPRKATTSIAGTVVNVSFTNVQQQASGGLQEITRQGSSAGATWANAALSSTTTLTGYDSYTLIGPLGTTTHTGTGLSSSTTQTAVGGAQLSSQNTTTNAFGGLTTGNSSSSSGVGQGPTKVTPGSGGTPDPFGRTSSVTVNASNGNIKTPLTTNYSNYGWLGPQSVTDPTGENTAYTYTPTGQIATATIYAGGSHSVTTTYTYDAAGNVIQTVQTGTYNGQTLSTTSSASYDVLGRLVSSTDADGNTTTYEYTPNALGTLVTTTLPDGATQELQQYALDGTLLSTTGSAVADPSTGDEGVVNFAISEPGDITIPAGSTWTLTSTNNGSDWTKIYTNLLGQQFYTQQSGPNGVTVSTDTTYDGNGRPVTFQDVDGSVTHTDYNPADGSVLDTWVDMNGNGVYDPGVDSKTVNTITASTTDDSQWAGDTTTDLSASGNQQTITDSKDSGLDTQSTSDGLTTSTSTTFTGSDGSVTVTTTNPDGTKTVDNYTEGLLMSEVQEGTDGSTISTVSYGYDALRRNNSVTDWTGQTTFQLRADGSVQSMTLPDGRAETINAQDANTQLPTDVTRLDGQHVTQAISPTGQTTSQSGAGTTSASYGYDPVTGQLSSLTVFPSGSSTDTTGQQTTGWKYGLSTGLLSTKTYADGSTDTFTYNNKLQLSAESLRGNTASFNYNSAGMQTGATYIGGGTGTTIYDSLGTLDDLGRSHVMTEVTTTANGQGTSTSDILSYTQQGQVSSEAQASGVTVHYDYNTDSSIEDMKLYQNGQVISETDYSYDPTTKRLATITINGVTYTYTYKTNTNLVSSVGTNANTVSYGYESNTGRLQSITATSSSKTDYSAGYTYTDNDQRLTEDVLQENPDAQAIDQRDWTFGYDAQDELTSVSEDGTALYSYPYDGVGNRTDAGTVNSMNQYGSLQYNAQGDVIDDGQFSYTWDSKNRLTSATPDSPDAQSQKDVFTYDPEDRRTQEDIYTWSSDNQDWVYASSLKFVYDGSQMVAELNGQNQLLQSYAWGPTGALLSITDYGWGTPQNYQVVTDGSGDVVELLDSSTGLVAASYQYDPWGNPTSATGPGANVSPFRWQGEFYDASFGGYYMGEREESARLHLFLSPDPSGESSDDNLYRPVGNDPINKIDPTGLADAPAPDDLWKEFWSAHPIQNGVIDPMSAVMNAPTIQPVYTGPYITAVPDPTFLQRVTAYAKEADNVIINHSDLGLYNGVASIINNIVYDWETNYQHPVFEDRSSVPQIPLFNPQFHIDATTDPNADAHMRVMNKTFSGVTTLAGVFIAAPEVGLSEQSAAIATNAGKAAMPSVFEPQVGASIEKLATEGEGVGIAINNAGFPSPMVEVTRTTPSELIDAARAEFNSTRIDATSRANFLRQFADTPGAKSFFNDSELAVMRSGQVPTDWQVHHMQPLFRGGDNSFDNLILVPKQWHIDNSFNLHFYPEGKNPFGRN